MWRSIPRTLFIGLALPVLMMALWATSWLIADSSQWQGIAMISVAEAITSSVMVAIGAFELARVHRDWRATAARIACVAAAVHVLIVVADLVLGLIVFASNAELEVLVKFESVLSYATTIAFVTSVGSLTLTAKRGRAVIVPFAIALTTLEHPPPVLARAVRGLWSGGWISLLLLLVPVGSALLQLLAVGDGARGKSLGIRNVPRAILGSRLAGFTAWFAAATAAVTAVMASTDAYDASLVVAGLATIVIGIAMTIAGLAIARAHHEAISGLLVSFAAAGALISATSVAYLLARLAARSLGDGDRLSWSLNQLDSLTLLPYAVIGGALAFASLGLALRRYALRRRAVSIARWFAVRLAVFGVVPAFALVEEGDHPVALAGAAAIACAALAGGFFAAGRELGRDVADPVAEVFA